MLGPSLGLWKRSCSIWHGKYHVVILSIFYIWDGQYAKIVTSSQIYILLCKELFRELANTGMDPCARGPHTHTHTHTHNCANISICGPGLEQKSEISLPDSTAKEKKLWFSVKRNWIFTKSTNYWNSAEINCVSYLQSNEFQRSKCPN